MVTNWVVQVILSVIFGTTGGYFAVRVAWGFSWVDRIINLTHVLMSAVMLAMSWPWGMAIPVALQVAVFTLAAFWFVYLALFRPRADIGPIEGHHQRPLLLWYHAIMMGSMVWMAAIMALVEPGSGAEGNGMSGMSMPGISLPASPGHDSGAATMNALPGWAVVASFVFAAFFVVAAVAFAVWTCRARHSRGTRRAHALLVDECARIAMAIGMAIAFIALT